MALSLVSLAVSACMTLPGYLRERCLMMNANGVIEDIFEDEDEKLSLLESSQDEFSLNWKDVLEKDEVDYVRIVGVGGFAKKDTRRRETFNKISNRFSESHLDAVWLLGGNFRETPSAPSSSGIDNSMIEKSRIFEETVSSSALLSNSQFTVVIGNSDRKGSISDLIEYSHPNWTFPHPYYFVNFVSQGTSRVGVCTWFLDTSKEGWTEGQKEWLVSDLSHKSESTACKWTVVVGNHPVLVSGDEKTHERTRTLVAELKPILDQFHVDLYVSSHSHSSEVLRAAGTTETSFNTLYVISGDISDDGIHLKKDKDKHPSSVWYDHRKYGFVEFTFSIERLNLFFHASRANPNSFPYKSLSLFKSHQTQGGTRRKVGQNGISTPPAEPLEMASTRASLSSAPSRMNRLEMFRHQESEDILYSMFRHSEVMDHLPGPDMMSLTSSNMLSFAIIGDWGHAGEELDKTSELLFDYHTKHGLVDRRHGISKQGPDCVFTSLLGPCIIHDGASSGRSSGSGLDAVLMLGDNFYPSGISKKLELDDPQFRLFTDVLAGRLWDLSFYTLLGNHDYLGSIRAQLAFNERDSRWNLPSRYYRKKFASGQVNACIWFTDTNQVDDDQLSWLSSSLRDDSNQCDWKFVLGHHPMFSAGEYSSSSRLGYLRDKFLPIFREYGVDVYLAGHEHQSMILTDEMNPEFNKPLFIVSGATAERRDPVANMIPNCIWIDPANIGFPVMNVYKTYTQFIFMNAYSPIGSPPLKTLTIRKVSTHTNAIQVV